MKKMLIWLAFAAVFGTLCLGRHRASAFMGEGCADKPCAECHILTAEEVQEVIGPQLKRLTRGSSGEIVGTLMSPVGGLWEIDFRVNSGETSKILPIYLDFSKKYLIAGKVIQIDELRDISEERSIDLNRVDVATIPLDDAVVIGDPQASQRIIVFDDPECPYCKKIHGEMKKLVAERSDIAFFIKLLPLKIHPDARRKSKAIICAKSLEMLDDSLAGRPVPDPTCETDQIEQNEALARQLGVGSTPTLILPDGRVMPGFKPAKKIAALLEGRKTAAGAAKRE